MMDIRCPTVRPLLDLSVDVGAVCSTFPASVELYPVQAKSARLLCKIGRVQLRLLEAHNGNVEAVEALRNHSNQPSSRLYEIQGGHLDVLPVGGQIHRRYADTMALDVHHLIKVIRHCRIQ
ncbi:MAG: hypothetical protein JWN34_5398 [Bryobacterales bacterium]|nr:hypothetical protein [Bryobacterales bacterium]